MPLMELHGSGRRTWPRVTLTLPPEARDELHALAQRNLRDPRREALRILLDGIERERADDRVLAR